MFIHHQQLLAVGVRAIDSEGPLNKTRLLDSLNVVTGEYSALSSFRHYFITPTKMVPNGHFRTVASYSGRTSLSNRYGEQRNNNYGAPIGTIRVHTLHYELDPDPKVRTAGFYGDG